MGFASFHAVADNVNYESLAVGLPVFCASLIGCNEC